MKMIFRYYWKRHWNNEKAFAFLQGRYFIANNNLLSSQTISSAVINIFPDSLFPFIFTSNFENLRVCAQVAFIFLYNEGLICRNNTTATEASNTDNTFIAQAHKVDPTHKNELCWTFWFRPINAQIDSFLKDKIRVRNLKNSIIHEINRITRIKLNANKDGQIQIPIIYCTDCGETTIPLDLIINKYSMSGKIKCPFCHEQAVWDDGRLTMEAATILCFFVSIIQYDYPGGILPATKNTLFLVAILIWNIVKRQINDR